MALGGRILNIYDVYVNTTVNTCPLYLLTPLTTIPRLNMQMLPWNAVYIALIFFRILADRLQAPSEDTFFPLCPLFFSAPEMQGVWSAGPHEWMPGYTKGTYAGLQRGEW